MSFNIERLHELVDDVNAQEDADFEETTREERWWMQEYRELATQVLAFYGHKVSNETSEIETNKAIAKMAGTRL